MKVPISEIKEYLQNNEVPTQLQLNECSFISDTKVFIDTHLSILQRNKGNKTFTPYYDRLCDFYKKVKDGKIY